jgi:hypothetical protein
MGWSLGKLNSGKQVILFQLRRDAHRALTADRREWGQDAARNEEKWVVALKREGGNETRRYTGQWRTRNSST